MGSKGQHYFTKRCCRTRPDILSAEELSALTLRTPPADDLLNIVLWWFVVISHRTRWG